MTVHGYVTLRTPAAKEERRQKKRKKKECRAEIGHSGGEENEVS